MRFHKKLFILLAFIFLAATNQSSLTDWDSANALSVNTPILTEVVSGSAPYFKGEMASGTEVMVYFDGVFAGLASQTSTGNATNTFLYKYSSKLAGGEHEVTVIARDKVSLAKSPVSEKRKFTLPVLPAPTLILPNEKTITADPRPLIEGVAVSGTFAHLYIDGYYNGRTPILHHPSGTASISYKPFLNLGIGWHSAYAVSENSLGEQSLVSNTIKFRIEQPMVSPTLRSVVHTSDYSRPNIVGLAKNGSKVKVYIDKKFVGYAKVKDASSGTASFAFRPATGLSNGTHLVFVTGIDSRGKESSWSNFQHIVIKKPVVSTNAPASAVIAKPKPKPADDKSVKGDKVILDSDGDGISDEDERNKYKTDPFSRDTDGDGYDDLVELKNGYDPLVPAVGKQDDKSDSDQSIDKDKTDSELASTSTSTTQVSNIKLNLLIFASFLIGLVLWILWVNKEIIKERSGVNKETDEVKE
jgi:hypothetical protein